MQFITSVAALVAFVSSALAQTEGFDAITSPTDGETLTAGQTYTITWDPTAAYNDETVTIRLLQGASQGSLDFNPTSVVGMSSPALSPISRSWSLHFINFVRPSEHQELSRHLLMVRRQQPGWLQHLRTRAPARFGHNHLPILVPIPHRGGRDQQLEHHQLYHLDYLHRYRLGDHQRLDHCFF